MSKGIRYLAASALLIISLSGCAKAPEPPELAQEYTAQIEFTTQSLTGTAALTKTEASGLTLEFLSPETLCGYSMCIADGEVSLSFGEVTADLGKSLPDGALITVLSDVLSAKPEGLQTVFQNPSWEFTGTLPKAAGDFLLTVSDTGVPLELLAEHAGISVIFHQTELLSLPEE